MTKYEKQGVGSHFREGGRNQYGHAIRFRKGTPDLFSSFFQILIRPGRTTLRVAGYCDAGRPYCTKTTVFLVPLHFFWRTWS